MTGSFHTSRGGCLTYECAGQGSLAVVFLHGFGGHAGFWRFQREQLRPFARILAVNWPGHGGSSWQSSTVAEMAADVLQLMSFCGIDRAVVAASSLGALPALKMAGLSRSSVQSLFLAGGLPRFTATDDFPAGLDLERIRKLAGQFDRDIEGVLAMFFRSLFTVEERSASGYGQLRDIMREKPLPVKAALTGMLDILQEADLRDDLRSCPVPVHFLFGGSDPICPPAVIGPLKRLVPEAVFHVFSGCGHFPFMTRPQETGLLIRKSGE